MPALDLLGRPRASGLTDLLRSDGRGQSTGIANFFLSLVIGAVMAWLTTEITSPLFAHVRGRYSDATAMTTANYLETFITNFPMMVLFWSFFSMIALSVYQRELLR